jgi:hypothetical protein
MMIVMCVPIVMLKKSCLFLVPVLKVYCMSNKFVIHCLDLVYMDVSLTCRRHECASWGQTKKTVHIGDRVHVGGFTLSYRSYCNKE